MTKIAPAGLLAFALAVAPAVAERLDWAEPFSGDWTLSGMTEGAAYCRIRLGAEGVTGGAAIDVSATCRRNFPLEDVAAWTLRADQLVLIDALRQPVLAFSKSEGDFYLAELPDGEALSLDRGAPTPPAELLDGTFTLSGPANAGACGFFLTAQSDTEGSIEQAGACPPEWKDRAWASWTLAKGRLHLRAADGTVILSVDEADGFTFLAEGVEGPLLFGPGVIEAED